MRSSISRHFNQTSDKVMSVDELTEKFKSPGDAPDSTERDRQMLSDMASWQDADGKLYVSEMVVKGTFTMLVGFMEDADPEVPKKFAEMQAAMDACEDHIEKTQPKLKVRPL